MFEYDEMIPNRKGTPRYFLNGELVGKKCTKCGKDREVAEFAKKADGLRAACRNCTAVMGATYYTENAEQIKTYRATHKAVRADYTSAYYKANAEKIKAQRAVYYADNTEQILTQKAEKRARNNARTDSEVLADQLRLRPTGTKICRVCREELPLSEYCANRGSADGLDITCRDCLTAKRSRDARAYWGTLGIDPTFCFYCEFPIYDGDELHSDHVIAVENGGPDTMENQVPTCRSCNICKSDKDFMVFLAEDFPYQEDQERIMEKLNHFGIAWAL